MKIPTTPPEGFFIFGLGPVNTGSKSASKDLASFLNSGEWQIPAYGISHELYYAIRIGSKLEKINTKQL